MMPVARLGDVLDDVQPGFASGDNLDSGVFQIRMNNLTRAGELTLAERRRVNPGQRQMEKYLLAAGDVLFNATNSPELVGKVAHFDRCDEPAVYSNHFLRLRVDAKRLDSKYLTRWLRKKFQQGYFSAKSKQWSNQATFGADRLVELEIELPPIDEQRRIAAVLDAADELRAKRREALTKLDTLTQAIFVDMFGDPARVHDAWPASELEDLVAEATSVTYGIVQAGDECPGGVPYIRTGDIVDGHIVTDGLRHTAPEVAARFERSKVRAGDLVMSIRATVGTVARVPQELEGANLTQGTARIAPGEGVEAVYLLKYLQSPGAQRWIARQVKGATFREITLGRLRELPVPVPPPALQARFASRVAAVEEAAGSMAASASALGRMFGALQQRAFRGEL